MCVIIQVGDRHGMTDKEINSAVTINSDGMGIMFLEDGKIKVFKRKNIKTQKSVLKKFFEEKSNFIVHLRMATHGSKSRKNIHPFFVTKKEWGDEHDIALVHNGVIQPTIIQRFLTKNPMEVGDSDTAYFAKALRDLGIRSIGHLKSLSQDISCVIGQTNKVLFLSSEGETFELGKFQEYKGCKVSNTYSFERGLYVYPSYAAYACYPFHHQQLNKSTTKDMEDFYAY